MTELQITPATEMDVDQILKLLLLEYDPDAGVGFYGNRNLIRRGVGEDLWVAREDGRVAGFLLGKYAPDILWVDPVRRNRQIGTTLFKTSLERAFDDNVNAMDIECMPPSSYGYWKRHGFESYGRSGQWGATKARRILSRTLPIPAGLTETAVTIAFYPEDGLYRNDVAPIVSRDMIAGLDSDGVIWLPERIIAFNDGATDRDTAVRMAIAGRELCFCKAKYPEAKALGVATDRPGSTFYIDQIATSANGG